MYIKKLEIAGISGLIREVDFKLGLNLIIDNPDKSTDTQTGNNVGKTTVLRLIDFCLGGQSKSIYKSNESKSDSYLDVVDYLTSNQIIVSLILLYDWSDEKSTVELKRQFREKDLPTHNFINGVMYSEDEYKSKIRELFFPELVNNRPTLREIISHNFRYDETRLDATLKTLHPTASLDEYDVLNLYLFNSDSSYASRKIKAKKDLEVQIGFQRGLNNEYSRTSLKEKIKKTNAEITKIEQLTNSLLIDCERDKDVKKLNKIRKKRTECIISISDFDFKIRTINNTISSFKRGNFSDNIITIKELYGEANAVLLNLAVTFEELVDFHNRMNKEKIKFISEDLKKYTRLKEQKESELKILDNEIAVIESRIRKTISVEHMQNLISQLNTAYASKAEFELCLNQMDNVKERVQNLKVENSNINESAQSIQVELQLKNNVEKFNVFFTALSEELYGVGNKLLFEKRKHGNFEFYFEQPSMSTGRKQGESLCFDVAYVMYADSINKNCLHFILNDKKELMDGTQLSKIPDIVNNKNIQIIVSMLYDKLPSNIQTNADDYIVLTLSQNDKLFRF